MLFIDIPHHKVTHPLPLDVHLNVAVLQVASRLFPRGFNVSDDAPQTFERLKQLLDTTGRMTVYAGGSETTIYGDREVNYAFRAWHDWCHWRGAHDFSCEGERAVYEMQRAHLVLLYGDGDLTRRWRRILYAEIIGQQAYFDRHGIFPVDQRAFVESFSSQGELPRGKPCAAAHVAKRVIRPEPVRPPRKPPPYPLPATRYNSTRAASRASTHHCGVPIAGDSS